MIENMPLNFTLLIFYAVFATQILFVSVYLPAKTLKRINFVRKNYPKETYPKLYPEGAGGLLASISGLRVLYRYANYFIASVGFVGLAAMLITGFEPHPLGGSEIFVMLYFILQILPIVILGVSEYEQFKGMRQAVKKAKRTAELAPRRLFDFISPGWVFGAVIAYLCWLGVFIYDTNLDGPWQTKHFVGVAIITFLNLAYAVYIAKIALVKKQDPFKATKDHHTQVSATVKSLVFSSTIISLYSIVSMAADRYAFEIFDPVMTSIFLQACLLFGFNLMLDMQPVDELDFEVYKNDAEQPT
ncbi:hypothetical protein [Maritalea porphyrae]|uniref:hypothetical protein n=1 Tax=Maritalea porphyrae TaxID=880732 RepID=UPI0022AFC852|nr:hypothetical protein [Maritalea porphyrae]MCZ4271107.1 hypothetical protein [Maritalea porphyrae]